MSLKSAFAKMALALVVTAGLGASPAFAQDAFNSLGNGGTVDTGSKLNTQTGTQTMQPGGMANSPQLQGATNGTIAPQGQDATVIQGVNTAGTVRVNNLANLEALLNIIATRLPSGETAVSPSRFMAIMSSKVIGRLACAKPAAATTRTKNNVKIFAVLENRFLH